MSVGCCIRLCYLVLLGLVVTALLFYAAYISTSLFVVRLPIPQSYHQPYNESATVSTEGSFSPGNLWNVASSETLNKSRTPPKKNSVNIVVTAAASSTVQQLNKITASATDSISLGVIPQSTHESKHLNLNPNICTDLGNTLQLLIIVTSAPHHSEARMAVRQTWGHYTTRRDVSIAFILGTTSNVNLNVELNAEEYMYGDIMRGKFIDTYDNLTLKTISMLEWVDNYCPNVAFVLKTDDDMFINVSKLLSFISKRNRNDRVIYGKVVKKWKPFRNKRSKYYLSWRQYKRRVLPDFTTGPAYLISSSVVHDLYTAALILVRGHSYLKLEDVFITGIVGNSIKVKLVHINEFVNKRILFNPCDIQKSISIHMVNYSEQFDLWKKLLDGESTCK